MDQENTHYEKVDWERLLDGLSPEVEWSSMTLPDDRDSEGTVATIRILGSMWLDVSYDSDDCAYIVRLYPEDYIDPLCQRACATDKEAIQCAVAFGRDAVDVRASSQIK
jgi:hypothetical protein